MHAGFVSAPPTRQGAIGNHEWRIATFFFQHHASARHRRGTRLSRAVRWTGRNASHGSDRTDYHHGNVDRDTHNNDRHNNERRYVDDVGPTSATTATTTSAGSSTTASSSTSTTTTGDPTTTVDGSTTTSTTSTTSITATTTVPGTVSVTVLLTGPTRWSSVQPNLFRVLVYGNGGQPVPAGQVEIRENTAASTPLATRSVLPGQWADYNVALSEGPHTIIARFKPTVGSVSTDSAAITASALPLEIPVVTVTPAATTVNEDEPFDVTVHAQDQAGVPVTGAVTITNYEGGPVIASGQLDAAGNIVVPTATGYYWSSILVTVLPVGQFAESATTVPLTVVPAYVLTIQTPPEVVRGVSYEATLKATSRTGTVQTTGLTTVTLWDDTELTAQIEVDGFARYNVTPIDNAYLNANYLAPNGRFYYANADPVLKLKATLTGTYLSVDAGGVTWKVKVVGDETTIPTGDVTGTWQNVTVTGTLDATGEATMYAPVPLAETVALSYAGDATYAPATTTLYVPDATSVTINVPAELNIGSSAHLIANVYGYYLGNINGGQVEFKNGPTTIGTAPLINGYADLAIVVAAGDYSLTATFTGADGTATSDPYVRIGKWASTVDIGYTSVTATQVGLKITPSRVISIGAVTGTVEVWKAATFIDSAPLVNGTADITIKEPTGIALTIKYSGDDESHGSTKNIEVPRLVNIEIEPYHWFLTGEPSPILVRAQNTIGFTPVTGGTITVYEGTTVLGTGPPDPSGDTYINVTLAPGSHTLHAVYEINGETYESVTRTADAKFVPVVTATTPAFNADGTSTWTMTVAKPIGAASASNATVEVWGLAGYGAPTLATGQLDANGTITFTVTAPPGTTLQVHKNTDDLYHEATTQVTLGQGTTTTLVLPEKPVAGKTNTFQVSVKDLTGTPVPAGQVELLNGTTVIGTASLTNGSATITVALILADYSFSARFVGATTTAGSKTTPTARRAKWESSITLYSAPSSSSPSLQWRAKVTVPGQTIAITSGLTGSVGGRNTVGQLGYYSVYPDQFAINTWAHVGTQTVTTDYAGNADIYPSTTSFTTTIRRGTYGTGISVPEAIVVGSTKEVTVSVYSTYFTDLPIQVRVTRPGFPVETVTVSQATTQTATFAIDTTNDSDQQWTIETLGNADWGPTTDQQTIRFNHQTVSTYLTVPNQPTINQPIPINVYVSIPGGSTNGSVRLFRNNTAIGDAVLNQSGSATFTDTVTTNGLATWRAVYLGALPTNILADRYESETRVEVRGTAQLEITSNGAPRTAGQPATFEAKIVTNDAKYPWANTSDNATWTVKSGATTISTGPISSNATINFQIPNVPANPQYFTLQFSGNTHYAPATQTFEVGPAVRPYFEFSAISDSGNSASLRAFAYEFEFIDQDGYSTPQGPLQTGLVRFTENGQTIATAYINLQGLAQTNVTLPAGVHTIVAIFAGTGRFASATSPPVAVTVRGDVTVNATLETVEAIRGTTAVVNIAVTPTTGTANPSGNVDIVVNNTLTTTATLDAAGKVSVPLSGLPLGSNNIRASYKGDYLFFPEYSQAVTQTVVVPYGLTIATAVDQGTISGATVGFTVNSLRPLTGTTASWTFGDGKTSTALNPTHTYDTAGVYTAEVTVRTSATVFETQQVSITVDKSATTLATTLSPAAPVAGGSVNVNVTVNANAALVDPTGTIIAVQNGAQIGTASITNRAATITLSGLSAGTQSVEFRYAGDTNFLPSTTTTPIVVIRGTTTVGGATVGTPTVGKPAVMRLTVTKDVAAGSGTVVPTGSVRVMQTGKPDIVQPINTTGTTDITIDTTNAGDQSFTIAYLGDSNFDSSTSTTTVTVAKAATVVVLTYSPDPVTSGEPVTFTATVNTPGSTGVTPTGTVKLFDGTVLLDTVTVGVDGTAEIVHTPTTGGTHTYKAVYSGDINLTGSTLTKSVLVFEPPIDLVAELPAIAVGQMGVFSVKVPQTGTRPIPTGVVHLKFGNIEKGFALIDANGEATITVTGAAAGTYQVTARYDGDTKYVPGNSGVVTFAVRAPLVVTINGNKQGLAPFNAAFTATVHGGAGGAPTVEWSFGDDTGTTAGLSTQHLFGQPGTYQVTARATVDGQTKTEQIIVQVSAAPLAAKMAVTNIRTVQGLSVSFDGSASSGPIRRAYWDFGDGSPIVDGFTPTHTYTTAGAFNVTLTVADAVTGGLTQTQPGAVNVASRSDARLIVKGVTGTPIDGVELFLRSKKTPSLEYRGVTGNDGRAILPALIDDTYEVFAYKDGFNPESVALTLPPAPTAPDQTITLDVGQAAAVEFAPPALLTPVQIAAAGIDTSKPENRQINIYQVALGTVTAPINVPVCVNTINEPVTCPVQPNAATPVGPPIVNAAGPAGAGTTTTQTFAGGGQVIYTTISKDTVTYLTMPLQGTFVKEFFQAKMLIANRAPSTSPGFVLHDGTAQIAVPPNMTVMPNRLPFTSNCAAGRIDPSPTAISAGYPSRVTVGDIPAAGCAEVDWVLRGDTTCSCFITGAYDAVLAPFERAIRTVAKSAEPYVVYGAEALQVVADIVASDELTPVAGQPNTYDIKAGTVIEYKISARNVTPNDPKLGRTLTGIEISYPAAGGVTALGPFYSNAQTVDQPIRATIDTLGPLQQKQVGVLRLYATKDATVTFPAASGVVQSIGAELLRGNETVVMLMLLVRVVG
jgi:PKD repeat protein